MVNQWVLCHVLRQQKTTDGICLLIRQLNSIRVMLDFSDVTSMETNIRWIELRDNE